MDTLTTTTIPAPSVALGTLRRRLIVCAQGRIDTARCERRYRDAERIAAAVHRINGHAALSAADRVRAQAARLARLTIDERIGRTPAR